MSLPLREWYMYNKHSGCELYVCKLYMCNESNMRVTIVFWRNWLNATSIRFTYYANKFSFVICWHTELYTRCNYANNYHLFLQTFKEDAVSLTWFIIYAPMLHYLHRTSFIFVIIAFCKLHIICICRFGYGNSS